MRTKSQLKTTDPGISDDSQPADRNIGGVGFEVWDGLGFKV